MGTATVIAQQGDTVDAICHRHLGRTNSITEQVLALNPGLASHGNVLPEGTKLLMPTLQQFPAQKQTIQLWD